jgi:hypothetical protein
MHEGPQRRQARVAGSNLAAALLLQMVQEGQDGGRAPVRHALLTWRWPTPGLNEGQEQPERIAVTGHGMGTGVLLGHQALAEEAMQQLA